MEIIIAIILSLFIILDIRFSNNITNMLNTPIGLISLFLINGLISPFTHIQQSSGLLEYVDSNIKKQHKTLKSLLFMCFMGNKPFKIKKSAARIIRRSVR